MDAFDHSHDSAEVCAMCEDLVSRGEAIGLVCPASRCDFCGALSRGWRGSCFCREVPEDDPGASFPEHDEGASFGYLVLAGSDPEDVQASFLTRDRVRALIQQGRRAIDVLTGHEATLGHI